MCFDPREEIHSNLKSAGQSIRRARKIAEDVGDSDGAQDLKELEESVGDKADRFDKGAM